MDRPIYKFYDLETLTQEDLNKLALERNTLAEEKEKLLSVINELRLYNDHLIRDTKYHVNVGHLKKIKKILDGVK